LAKHFSEKEKQQLRCHAVLDRARDALPTRAPAWPAQSAHVSFRFPKHDGNETRNVIIGCAYA